MDIGDIIKKLRKENGITQKQLAQMTGLAEITIRQYEAKKYVPKQAQLQKLCDALGVDINSLIFANSIDFRKAVAETEMDNCNNETLDYFASWLVANNIFFERELNTNDEGYSFHFDNKKYFLNTKQKQALSSSSIELVKTLIKLLSSEFDNTKGTP